MLYFIPFQRGVKGWVRGGVGVMLGFSFPIAVEIKCCFTNPENLRIVSGFPIKFKSIFPTLKCQNPNIQAKKSVKSRRPVKGSTALKVFLCSALKC
jgi:hypothetical protein